MQITPCKKKIVIDFFFFAITIRRIRLFYTYKNPSINICTLNKKKKCGKQKTSFYSNMYPRIKSTIFSNSLTKTLL